MPRRGSGTAAPPVTAAGGRLGPDARPDRRNSEADRGVGLLFRVCQTLPNPYLLSRSLMRRESVLSSRIEGTQASLSDLLIYEAKGEPAGASSDDEREVANHVAAMVAMLDPEEFPTSRSKTPSALACSTCSRSSAVARRRRPGTLHRTVQEPIVDGSVLPEWSLPPWAAGRDNRVRATTRRSRP